MIEETMKEYVEEQAERLGVSQSGFINMCIANYKEQKEAIQGMNNMKQLIYKIEELSRKADKK